jgi:23S rRNA (guanosine2251-2'-O)-methyltransferase
MSRSRRSRKQKLMGSHQRSWIWGRHAVLETLRSDRWRPVEVHACHDVEDEIKSELNSWLQDSAAFFESADAPVLKFDSGERLRQLCSHSDHQGLIARMPEYPYLCAKDVRENLSERSALLVLDGLHDAFNFGACLRCAEVFGVDAVVIGKDNQCGVTSQVVRSSAGAVHHLPLARTDDLPAALREFRESGLAVVAATEKAETPLPAVDFRVPVAIVIGNEGTGISDALLAECTERVRIPQSGRVSSLNAAVATGIILYELVRQRTFPGEPSP